jgi:hypothetical protein
MGMDWLKAASDIIECLLINHQIDIIFTSPKFVFKSLPQTYSSSLIIIYQPYVNLIILRETMNVDRLTNVLDHTSPMHGENDEITPSAVIRS